MSRTKRVSPVYLALFVGLYAVQGVVVAYFFNFNQIFMQASGVSAEATAKVQSLALVPFILKFLGGPISDRFNLLGFGHRKPYIVVGLVVQMLGLLGLVAVHPGRYLGAFTTLAVLTVTGLALYDTCCDGMVIDVTPPDDRPRVQGALVAARAVAATICSFAFGAWLEGEVGGLERFFKVIYTCAALGMVPLILALWVREPRRAADAERFQWEALRVLILPRSLILLAFGAFYATVGYGIEINLSPYYQSLHFQEGQIGTYASIRYIGRAAGAALMPISAGRLGRRWVLRIGILMLAASAVGQVLVVGTASAILGAFAFGVANGWNDALYYVLAMEASDPRMAASTYALFMAVSNVSVMGGWVFAEVAAALGHGFTRAFIASALFTLIAWPLIRPLSRPAPDPQLEPADVLA